MNHEHMLCPYCREKYKTIGISEIAAAIGVKMLCGSCQHNIKAIDFWQRESKWQKEYRQPETEPWEMVDQKYPSFSEGDSQKILDVVSNTQINHLITIDMILKVIPVFGKLRDSGLFPLSILEDSLKTHTQPKDTKSEEPTKAPKEDNPEESLPPSLAEKLTRYLAYSTFHTSAEDLKPILKTMGVSPRNAESSIKYGLQWLWEETQKKEEENASPN